MKIAIPSFLMISVFCWGTVLYALEGEIVPSDVADADSDLAVATASDEEVTQSIEEMLGRLLPLLEEAGNTLTLIKDKATADAQASKVSKIMNELVVLAEQFGDLELEFKGKEDVVKDVAKKHRDRFEILISKARIQGNRIADAEFYGSATLKAAFEKDTMILLYSSKSQPVEKAK